MKKFIFIMSVLFLLMLDCSSRGSYTNNTTKSNQLTGLFDKDSTVLSDTLTNTLTVVEKQELSHYSQLFEHVYNYISQVSKRDSTEKTEIAKTIINAALENNIDICFILAQGTNETHIGTTGIGTTRKSIFGIYKTYKSYESCINDYIRILKKNYLTKGRTCHDIMKHYVTTNGSRYAEYTGYERKLKKKYHQIKHKTNIYQLQKKIESFK
jgi:flagellum-specific peptidoglycan hydrolase FlgJ